MKKQLHLALTALIYLGVASKSVTAITYYYDISASPGLGGVSSLDWTNNATKLWNDIAAGTNDPATINAFWGTNATNDAIFDGTPDNISIISGGVFATGITVNVNGYSFSSGTLTLKSPANVVVASGVSTTFNSKLSGSNGYNLSGGGTFFLTNATNDITGAVNVAGGTILSVDDDGKLGNNAATLNLNGGTYNITANRGTGVNTVSNAISVSANSAITSTGIATGAMNVLFTGALTGTGGTLTFRNDGGPGSGIFDPRFSAGFTFNQPIVLAANPIDVGRTARLNSYNTTADGTQTFNGQITGSGSYRRAATTNGTGGTTILTAANTFSGGALLNDGSIGLGIDTAGPASAPDSGPLGKGTVSINEANGKLFASGGARVFGNAIVFGASGLGITGSNDLTLTGTVDLGGGGSRTITVNNTGATTFSGVISNGSITKAGSGKMILTNGNSYASGTVISGGNLQANNDPSAGSATGNGAVVVNNDGTLSGTGSVAGAVTLNNTAHLAPGSSIESLEIGTVVTPVTLSFNDTSNFDFELNSSGTPAADLVDLKGDVSIAPGANLNVTDLASTAVGLNAVKFTLISYTGTLTGIFASKPEGTIVSVGANTFRLSYSDLAGGGINFGGGTGTSFVTLTAVPEASTVVFGGLLCAVLGGIQVRRRFRRVPTQTSVE